MGIFAFSKQLKQQVMFLGNEERMIWESIPGSVPDLQN